MAEESARSGRGYDLVGANRAYRPPFWFLSLLYVFWMSLFGGNSEFVVRRFSQIDADLETGRMPVVRTETRIQKSDSELASGRRIIGRSSRAMRKLYLVRVWD